MPGMFGGTADTQPALEALHQEFCRLWTNTEITREGPFALGGYALGKRRSIYSSHRGDANSYSICVDGERSSYDWLEELLNGTSDLARPQPDCIDPESTESIHGNVVLVDSGTKTLRILSEHTGMFPLFFYVDGSQFLFSSHLRPLARAICAEVDPIGLGVYLHRAYHLGDRTLFKKISRLLPGQQLIYKASQMRFTIEERSEAWTEEVGSRSRSGKQLVKLLGSKAVSAAQAAIPESGDVGLMCSAGWDSRTLLALYDSVGERSSLTAFTHGDLNSRELMIAGELCTALDVKAIQRNIDLGCFDIEYIHHVFRRVESAMFPYWSRAGEMLYGQGCGVVWAGVLGPILNGHYGPESELRGAGKIWSVVGSLMGGTNRNHGPIDRKDVAVLTKLHGGIISSHLPGFLDPEYCASSPDMREAIHADVKRELKRLVERGVGSRTQLHEAFLMEHREAQTMGAQLRSCRTSVDVATPFGHRSLFNFASAIPYELKARAQLNQSLIRSMLPEALKLPTGAVLLPASAPILFQEASRFYRVLWSKARWHLHRLSNGAVSAPRFRWLNLEFLRESGIVVEIASELNAEFWNRRKIDKLVRQATSPSQDSAASVHPFIHQLLKMFTVEQMVQ